MGLTRVTSGFRLTVPKDVRKALGIRLGDYVSIEVEGDSAVLRRVGKGRASDLKGRLPATRAYPGLERVREEVGKELGRRRAAELSRESD